MNLTQKIRSQTEVSKAERRVVQSVFLYSHTIILDGREKLFDKKRSTKRLEMDGRSLGKVCLSLSESAVVVF